MKPPDLQIHLTARPRLLNTARALVRSYAETLGYSSRQADGIVLAIDEAVTNSIRHSYGGECEELIELTLDERDGRLEIVLRDDGTPAPEEKLQRKEIVHDPENLIPGGLGVQLIFRVFERVEYRPGATRGNVLELSMPLPSRRTEAEDGAHGAAD